MKKSLLYSLIVLGVFTFDHLLHISHRSVYAEIEGESIWTETEDGRQIHIFFIRARNKEKANFPVVLCHGIASQGKYWYFNEKSSWAVELAENGFDVFIPDLRGVGKSAKDGMNFSFYEYQKDVIAIIRKVKDATGAQKVHWIGHSMGGMVIYLVATEEPEFIKDIASFTAVASPYKIWLPFELFKFVRRNFDTITEALKKIDSVPFSLLTGLYGLLFPIIGYLGEIDVLTRSFQYFIWNIDIVEPEVRRDVIRGTADISSQVLEKFIRVGIGYEDFGFELSSLEVPSLFIVGTKDLIATPPTVRFAYFKAGGPNKRFILAGVGEGFSADYGHVDINVAVRSKLDVFPIVLEHISANDAKEDVKHIHKTERHISPLNKKTREKRCAEVKEGRDLEGEMVSEEKPVEVVRDGYGGMKNYRSKAHIFDPSIVKLLRRESKYSFLLVQDFGLRGDVWDDFASFFDKKNMAYVFSESMSSLDALAYLVDTFCRAGTSSYNIGILHGFAGVVAPKLRKTCFDVIFFISSPLKEMSKYYRMYLEAGGSVSPEVIERIFGDNVAVTSFSPLKGLLEELISADFLLEDDQRVFFILSVGTRTQYWWDIAEVPSLFRNYSFMIVSYVNFMEDASHLELLRGRKAKRYVIPYIMNQIANLKK